MMFLLHKNIETLIFLNYNKSLFQIEKFTKFIFFYKKFFIEICNFENLKFNDDDFFLNSVEKEKDSIYLIKFDIIIKINYLVRTTFFHNLVYLMFSHRFSFYIASSFYCSYIFFFQFIATMAIKIQ